MMTDCCKIEEPKSQPILCPNCNRKGQAVDRITLDSLLKNSAKNSLSNFPYLFCKTPTCEVVYFSEKQNDLFEKSDLNVHVGLKETKDPIPVCYCYRYSARDILDDARETGRSTIKEKIIQKVKEKDCFCERSNPSGSCCLGEVTKWGKKAKADKHIVQDNKGVHL